MLRGLPKISNPLLAIQLHHTGALGVLGGDGISA